MKPERIQLGLGRLVHWRQSEDNPQVIAQQLDETMAIGFGVNIRQ